MNNNNINKILINKMNSSEKLGEKIMPSVVKYDDFMKDLIEKIKSAPDVDSITKIIMAKIRGGELEQVSGNFYKYKDYHILELFKHDGVAYSEKLKKLDKLNLDITQKYIETVDKDGSVYIVTQIPGTEKGNLVPIWKRGANNIQKEDKLAAFHDLQKLTRAGLVDDRVLRSDELWYVNSDNKIVIPVFEYLRPITATEKSKEIIEKYYEILFK